jgi:hypothetical protein
MRFVHARRAVCGALAGLVAAALVALAQPADARSTFDSAYGFDRTYNAALRLVRVDMGLKITEKDDKSGYFVFDYSSPESGNKVSSGSIQFVRSPEADAPIRVVVQLPAMPRSHEQVLVDTLIRKMRQDYGDPPERPKQPAPAQPPSEGGADGGEDAE